MSPTSTAKVKLVTVIAPHGLGDQITSDLRSLGVEGYSQMRVEGWGKHGLRRFGLIDSANTRVEALVSAELAGAILERIVQRYTDAAVVAFAQDVDAVPQSRFS